MNRYYEHPTEKNFRSPVYNVRAVPVEKIVANSYNPNVVAPPEMKLLELSIWEDGYTMPCVCYYDAERDCYELVDGYHRYLVLKTSKRIYERERGLLPVTVIEKDLSNRMASTIRHNRARGTHNVELMSEIVAELTRARMSDQWIMRHIGMDRDELLRLKQITGLAELFSDKEFSLGDGHGRICAITARLFRNRDPLHRLIPFRVQRMGLIGRFPEVDPCNDPAVVRGTSASGRYSRCPSSRSPMTRYF